MAEAAIPLQKNEELVALGNTTTTMGAGAIHQEAMMFFPDLLLPNSSVRQQSSLFLRLSPEYPVTTLLLCIVHLLYFFQWRRAGRRVARRKILTFATFVERKHYYKWWTALLSQYHPPPIYRDGSMNPDPEQSSSGVNLTVAMGHEDDGAVEESSEFQRIVRAQGQRLRENLPQSLLESPIVLSMARRSVLLYGETHRCYLLAGGRSLLLLIYNSHILWSCRALERHYGYYLHVLVSVGMWVTMIEVAMSLHLLRQLSPRLTHSQSLPDSEAEFSEMTLFSPQVDSRGDSPALRQVRNMIRGRPLGVSLSMLSSALLVIFQTEFPFVATSVVPLIPLSKWLHLSPLVSHILSVLLLFLVSLAGSTKASTCMALASGSFVGLAWGAGWLDFCAELYWGRGMLCFALLLTLLSLKAKRPDSPHLAWIDYVSWSASGKMNVFDSASNQWIEQEELLGMASSIVEPADHSRESSDEESDSDESSVILRREAEMNHRDLSLDNENNPVVHSDDADESTRAPRVPTMRSNQVRSRRTGMLPNV